MMPRTRTISFSAKLLFCVCGTSTTTTASTYTGVRGHAGGSTTPTPEQPQSCFAQSCFEALREPLVREHISTFLPEKEFFAPANLQLFHDSKEDICRSLEKRGVGSAFAAKRIVGRLRAIAADEWHSIVQQPWAAEAEQQAVVVPEQYRQMTDHHRVVLRMQNNRRNAVPDLLHPFMHDFIDPFSSEEQLRQVEEAARPRAALLGPPPQLRGPRSWGGGPRRSAAYFSSEFYLLRTWTAAKIKLISELGDLCDPVAVDELRELLFGSAEVTFDFSQISGSDIAALEHNKASVAKAAAQSLAGVAVSCWREVEKTQCRSGDEKQGKEVVVELRQGPRGGQEQEEQVEQQNYSTKNNFCKMKAKTKSNPLRLRPQEAPRGPQPCRSVYKSVLELLYDVRVRGSRAPGASAASRQKFRELAIHALALICEHTADPVAFQRLANVRDNLHGIDHGQDQEHLQDKQGATAGALSASSPSSARTAASSSSGSSNSSTPVDTPKPNDVLQVVDYLSKVLDPGEKRPVARLSSYGHAPKSLVALELELLGAMETTGANPGATSRTREKNSSTRCSASSSLSCRQGPSDVLTQSEDWGRNAVELQELEELLNLHTVELRELREALGRAKVSASAVEGGGMSCAETVVLPRDGDHGARRSLDRLDLVVASSRYYAQSRYAGRALFHLWQRETAAGERTPPGRHQRGVPGGRSVVVSRTSTSLGSRGNLLNMGLAASAENDFEEDSCVHRIINVFAAAVNKGDAEGAERFGGGARHDLHEDHDGEGDDSAFTGRDDGKPYVAPSVALGEHPAAGAILETLKRAAANARQPRDRFVAREALAVIAARRTLQTPSWRMRGNASSSPSFDRAAPSASRSSRSRSIATTSPNYNSNAASAILLRDHGVALLANCLAGLTLRAKEVVRCSASRLSFDTCSRDVSKESLLAEHFRTELTRLVGFAGPANVASLLGGSPFRYDADEEFEFESFYKQSVQRNVLRRKREWVSWKEEGIGIETDRWHSSLLVPQPCRVQ